MNAFILMIPLFLIRFGLLSLINKEALGRAAFFAPLEENEKAVQYIYQISNIILIFSPLFLKIQIEFPLFMIDVVIYVLGIIILTISTVNYAKPSQNGINTNGIYQISRNPMYIGYFVYFLGCVLFTGSPVLLIGLIVFIITSHRIILAEEKWCMKEFGKEYKEYMKRVGRYL